MYTNGYVCIQMDMYVYEWIRTDMYTFTYSTIASRGTERHPFYIEASHRTDTVGFLSLFQNTKL